jgi:ubiquinone/menaquinone biosynthesis C-methylase UbiE
MKNDAIKKGYGSVSNIYDDYILAEKPLFKVIAKLIWGFTDREYSTELLEHIPDNFSGKLLDIPAGTGVLTCEKYLKTKNAEIICMDYSQDMLDIAKERFGANAISNIECKQGDVGDLPFGNETFDVVLSMNGFHAFPDKEKAFSEVKRVLKTNGLFIGCFYIKGKVKRTDWFIKNIFVRNGTFTPPFYDENEIAEKFRAQYKETKLWNTGSIVCFSCKK